MKAVKWLLNAIWWIGWRVVVVGCFGFGLYVGLHRLVDYFHDDFHDVVTASELRLKRERERFHEDPCKTEMRVFNLDGELYLGYRYSGAAPIGWFFGPFEYRTTHIVSDKANLLLQKTRGEPVRIKDVLEELGVC